jgi:hypothetical protein
VALGDLAGASKVVHPFIFSKSCEATKYWGTHFSSRRAKQISQEAVREAIHLEAQRRGAEIKTQQSKQDMDTFIETADRMQQRGHDYRMSGEYNSASGITKIEVSKHHTTAIIVISLVVALIALVLYLGRS